MLGRIAELGAKKFEEEALTISDAITYIPDVIKEIKAL